MFASITIQTKTKNKKNKPREAWATNTKTTSNGINGLLDCKYFIIPVRI